MATERRLIDANSVYELHSNYPAFARSYADLTDLRDILDDAPTVDAALVVHGHWEHMGEADYKCSVCGFRFTSGDPISMFPYCRCGAKMDGEGSETDGN